MERTCDLHLHSNCSDGSLSPAELAREAKRCGVDAAILTDHNTLRGTEEFIKTASAIGLEAAAGVEISCECEQKEVHILGLFLPLDQQDTIGEWLRKWEEKKQQSNRELVKRLQRAGIPISYEAMKARYAGSRLNRVHVARELCRLGWCKEVKEAFTKFLDPQKGFYVPAPKPEAGETIRIIRTWGGLPILAHPPMNVAWNRMEEYLQWARAQGAVGAEVYYSAYTPEEQKRMQELCEKAGLMESGGSDFHGDGKPDISIGVGKGELRIPYRVFEQLRRKSERERNKRNENSAGEPGAAVRY